VGNSFLASPPQITVWWNGLFHGRTLPLRARIEGKEGNTEKEPEGSMRDNAGGGVKISYILHMWYYTGYSTPACRPPPVLES